MQDLKNTEIKRWRRYAILVTVLGIIFFALPMSLVPNTYKIPLAIPLYAMFVYVYYKYLALKKGAQEASTAKEDSPDRQKITSGQNANKKQAQKGKATGKKGR